MSPLTMAKVPYRVIRPSPMRVFNPPPSDGSSLFRPSRALAMARDPCLGDAPPPPFWPGNGLDARVAATGVPGDGLSTTIFPFHPSPLSLIRSHREMVFPTEPSSSLGTAGVRRLLGLRRREREAAAARSGHRVETAEERGGAALQIHGRRERRRSSMRPPSAVGERAREQRRESDGGLVTCSGWWRAPVEKKRERGVE